LIPEKIMFFSTQGSSKGWKSFNFENNTNILKTHFILLYFAFYHGFQLFQRILWFYTIYRIIYFALKRKMLLHGLRPFFWPIPFKTREFIPIMNLKCILHAWAGKTMQKFSSECLTHRLRGNHFHVRIIKLQLQFHELYQFTYNLYWTLLS
jgi:hypothetical protein